ERAVDDCDVETEQQSRCRSDDGYEIDESRAAGIDSSARSRDHALHSPVQAEYRVGRTTSTRTRMSLPSPTGRTTVASWPASRAGSAAVCCAIGNPPKP